MLGVSNTVKHLYNEHHVHLASKTFHISYKKAKGNFQKFLIMNRNKWTLSHILLKFGVVDHFKPWKFPIYCSQKFFVGDLTEHWFSLNIIHISSLWFFFLACCLQQHGSLVGSKFLSCCPLRVSGGLTLITPYQLSGGSDVKLLLWQGVYRWQNSAELSQHLCGGI